MAYWKKLSERYVICLYSYILRHTKSVNILQNRIRASSEHNVLTVCLGELNSCQGRTVTYVCHTVLALAMLGSLPNSSCHVDSCKMLFWQRLLQTKAASRYQTYPRLSSQSTMASVVKRKMIISGRKKLLILYCKWHLQMYIRAIYI